MNWTVKLIAKGRLKEKLSSDRIAASSKWSCCSDSLTMSCSKEKCSASCWKPKERNCSGQIAASSRLSCCSKATCCSRAKRSESSKSMSCCCLLLNSTGWWPPGSRTDRCCYWCWCLEPRNSEQKTTVSGCWRPAAFDRIAAELTLDSASCSAAPMAFASDRGKSWACWAPALSYSEQARNLRSSPVPSLICTGSSSCVNSL
jgi:hypothetical protein